MSKRKLLFLKIAIIGILIIPTSLFAAGGAGFKGFPFGGRIIKMYPCALGQIVGFHITTSYPGIPGNYIWVPKISKSKPSGPPSLNKLIMGYAGTSSSCLNGGAGQIILEFGKETSEKDKK